MNGTNSFDWSWIVALLIIAGIFGNGFGGFGGNNVAGLTAVDLDSRFNARDIFNTNTSVLTTSSDTQKEVLTNRYENALGLAGIQKDILVGNQVMQGNLDSCCLNYA